MPGHRRARGRSTDRAGACAVALLACLRDAAARRANPLRSPAGRLPSGVDAAGHRGGTPHAEPPKGRADAANGRGRPNLRRAT